MKADSSMGPLLIVAMVLNTKWCRINIRTRKVRGVCSVFYLVPPGAIPYALRASAVHGSNGTLISEYFILLPLLGGWQLPLLPVVVPIRTKASDFVCKPSALYK